MKRDETIKKRCIELRTSFAILPMFMHDPAHTSNSGDVVEPPLTSIWKGNIQKVVRLIEVKITQFGI